MEDVKLAQPYPMRDEPLGCGLGFRVQGLGFRVQGLGLGLMEEIWKLVVYLEDLLT